MTRDTPDPYRAVVAAMTDAELTDTAQGCTELTCIYHGIVNAERRKRGLLSGPSAPLPPPRGEDNG